MASNYPFLLSQWPETKRLPRGGYGDNYGLAWGGDRPLGRVNVLESIGSSSRNYGWGITYGNDYGMHTYNNWLYTWRITGVQPMGGMLPFAIFGPAVLPILPRLVLFPVSLVGYTPYLSMHSWVPYSMQLLSKRTSKMIPDEA